MRKTLALLAAALFTAANFIPQGHNAEPPKENMALDERGLEAAKKKNTSERASSETAALANESDIFDGTLHFVAHRGENDVAPENSIPAFEAAGKSGFWGIETDVSETSDSYFVCMHDDTIDRTTTGEGAVGDYSLKQIMKFNIDVGSNISNYKNLKIPKLTDYLEVCREYGCVAVVEIKRINDHRGLLDILDQSGCPVIITGGIDDLKEIRKADKKYPLMVIGYAPETAEHYIREADSLGINCGVLLNHPLMDDEASDQLRQRGYYCGVWTVNDNRMAEEMYSKYNIDYVVADSAVCMKR